MQHHTLQVFDSVQQFSISQIIGVLTIKSFEHLFPLEICSPTS
jgi:hypothetical protein